MFALALLLAASLAATDGKPHLADAVALYEAACLRTFPDDAALDRLMKDRGAQPLSADDVKVTLGTDPGRAWQIGSGPDRLFLFLELPPFHACSVRFMMPDAVYDLSGYHEVERRYTASAGGFEDATPMNLDRDGLHIHLTGRQRKGPAGTESLMIVDQQVADIARRAAGETGVSLRFVRQIKQD